MSDTITLFLSFLLVGLFSIPAIAQQNTAATLLGTYHIGHNFGGSTLTLNGDGTYLRESSDCTLEYVQSGTYTSSPDGLHFKILKYIAKGHESEKEINLLDPAQRKEVFGNNFGTMPLEFALLPIRWSDRIYLIDEDDLTNFVNAVNFGLEPRSELTSEPYYGSFYLRVGDQQKKVSGEPGVPDSWRSILLRRPVVATIVAVKADAKGTLATLNKGSKSGLRVGMRLLAENEEPSPWSGVQIVSVSEKTAIIRTVDAIMVGDKLSTTYHSRIYR